MLFTLGRHRDATAIYLWGLVDHDAISSEAQRIEPSNAPFLAFEELEHEDRTELAIDDLPAPYFTQESVEEKVPEDYGPQRWLVFDDEEWGRLLASPDPASFEVLSSPHAGAGGAACLPAAGAPLGNGREAARRRCRSTTCCAAPGTAAAGCS